MLFRSGVALSLRILRLANPSHHPACATHIFDDVSAEFFAHTVDQEIHRIAFNFLVPAVDSLFQFEPSQSIFARIREKTFTANP